jgi:hypothetical protein
MACRVVVVFSPGSVVPVNFDRIFCQILKKHGADRVYVSVVVGGSTNFDEARSCDSMRVSRSSRPA